MAFQLRSQSPFNQQKSGTVKYGTPEYRSAYNKGEVVTKEGGRSPIALDEVVVSKKSPKAGFWKQSIKHYTEEHKDDGILGAIGSVVTYPMEVSQHAATYAATGKVQNPSKALGIKSAIGALAADVVLDPANFVGGVEGVSNTIRKGSKILSKADKVADVSKVVKGISKAEGPSNKAIDAIKDFSKNFDKPVKKSEAPKVTYHLDDAEEPDAWDTMMQKWKKADASADKKIGKYSEAHKQKFEGKYGTTYNKKDIDLYGRLQETELGKRDPNVANVITEAKDNLKSKDALERASMEKHDFQPQREFEKKHGISKKYTKTEELLNNVYTHGYDSNINNRTTHIGDKTNKTFYKKEVKPRLENLVKKNKLKSEESLYRGDYDYDVKHVWRGGVKQPKGSVKFSELQVGDVWKPKSFISTTQNQEISGAFGTIRSEIKAPKGQSILPSNSVKGGEYTAEKEVLLPSKLKFKVEGKLNAGTTKSGGKEGPKVFYKQSIVNPYTIAGGLGLSTMFQNNKK